MGAEFYTLGPPYDCDVFVLGAAQEGVQAPQRHRGLRVGNSGARGMSPVGLAQVTSDNHGIIIPFASVYERPLFSMAQAFLGHLE